MSEVKKMSASMALTKLVHVKMNVKGKNGPTLGLFIPLAANMLELHDANDINSAVYMDLNIHIKPETDDKGQDGFITKTTSSKIWKTLDEAGKEEAKKLSPILGNIKDWSRSGGGNDTAGAAQEGPADEHDDLPF